MSPDTSRDIMNVIVFDDHVENLRGALQLLNQQKRRTDLLWSFLEKVNSVLRDEVGRLPSWLRAQFPDFTALFDLAERYYTNGRHNAIIADTLMCVYQLAAFIVYLEERPSIHLNPKNTTVIGLGNGLLAGAAVAAATTIVDLIPLAVEAVRTTFHTAVVVSRVSGRLEETDAAYQSWSLLLRNVKVSDISEELDTFHEANKIPTSNKIYVRANGEGSVTISGTPSRLRKLASESDFVKSLKPIELPGHGLYHAAHLYGDHDARGIVDTVKTNVENNRRHINPLIFGSGVPVTTSNTHDLLEKAVLEILTQPLRWDDVRVSIISHLVASNTVSCRILSIGSSHTSKGLIAKIRIWTDINVQWEDLTLPKLARGSADKFSGRFSGSKIAIVGMSGRFPGAADCEQLWQLLEQGRDVHKKIPKDRFNVDTHCDPSGKIKNTSHTPYGCFIEQPGLFDARFFAMSPREAAQTDPMHRLALVTAYEALEQSGFVLNRTPSTMSSRVGTFYGQTSDDWREANVSQDIDTYFIPATVRAFAPGRINYYFKFSGPSYSIDTACSSSLAAVQVACTSLWSGEVDTAVTGGVNVLTAPDIFAGLSRGMFLSKTGGCKTFDSQADGYCRADCVGTVILKRLEDAEADGDNVLGVILGTATNHSAEAISITHPHAEAQSFLYQNVLYAAGVDASEVSYVEMHGTGTQAGDRTEAVSVMDVFAPKGGHRSDPLYLGAVKSNIGHGEAAAGIAALIKMLLMLQKNVIPPHVGIKNSFNPALPQDMVARNVHIPLEKVPWLPKAGNKRLAFLNNFSAAGGNTALLMEEGSPYLGNSREDPRSTHIITVSAKSIFSMKNNIQKLVSFLEQNTNISLADLSYTLSARRLHHAYRVAIAVSDIKDINAPLTARIDDPFSPIPSTRPVIGFVFTGQGALYCNMARQLFTDCATFRTELQHLDSVGIREGFPSFLSAVLDVNQQYLSPVVTQLLLVCVQIALTRMWKSWGLEPDVVIGHSLGEYAALHAAGVLSTIDTINLVGQRAKLLEAKCVENERAMLVVKSSPPAINSVLGPMTLEIACINSPTETVLSGTEGDVRDASALLASAGIKSMVLNVPFAFHSSQVDPILDEFEAIASGALFMKPNIPIISPLLGTTISDAGTFDATYLVRHAREPVNFLGAIQTCQGSQIIDPKTVWVELGPHPICSSMIKSSLKSVDTVAVPSLRKNEDPWTTIANSLCVLYCQGLKLNWTEMHRDFCCEHQLVALPTYSFDNKNYWVDYVGDWSLIKGNYPRVEEQVAPVIIEQKPPKLTTTTIHGIVEEHFEGTTGRVVARSDIAEPKLLTAISGHLVNGAGLCPSSVYADMALTLVDYLLKEMKVDTTNCDLDVTEMEVQKPLIADLKGSRPQVIHITATADLTQGRANLIYASVNAEGQETVRHAICVVVFGTLAEQWLSEWSRLQYLITGRIQQLQKSVQHGTAQKITRGMAYKLFSALVQYDPKYRGMEEVILDSAELEATSKVSFQAKETDGEFFCSPYWIDSLAHISGFIMNGSDVVDSVNFVYISHGWKSMRFSKRFSATKKYSSYVKMQAAGDNVVSGDVYILEDNLIIGLVGGLKFQRIPRKVLNSLLPPIGATVPGAKLTPKVQPAAKPVLESLPTREKMNLPLPTRQPVAAVISKPKLRDGEVSTSIISRALEIVASEAEIDISELQDECVFADLGIDSLLSLAITGKFREELGLDVPGTLFLNHPTMKSLRRQLSQYDSPMPILEEQDTSDSGDPSDHSLDTARTTPDSKDEAILTLIEDTIAEQMGLPLEEVTGDIDLGSIGMDSLMTISILGSLREQTGMDFSPSFFLDHPTMNDVKTFLSINSSNHSLTRLETYDGMLSLYPPAKSILMQGTPSKAKKLLFLFPDGSGSATSYAIIPNVGPDVCVFALDCPFMKTPEDYTCGIEIVSAIFLAEVRRRQPHGPYYLGGWSAGGIVAYEVTHQLHRAGEHVERLILFDSPCPLNLEPLPSRLHEFFNTVGLLGTGSKSGPPSWLLPHFDSSIKALTAYKAKPMDPKIAPKTFAIWATDGVCKYPTDPRPPELKNDPKSMKWLLNNRTDFGYNGWDQLLGGHNITTTKMACNHFTMMRDPQVKLLGNLIREGLA